MSILGYAAARNALAIKAGLNIFEPKPPKICLPTKIANIEPKLAAYQAVEGGKIKARSKPVKAALKSLIAEGRFLILKIILSVATAVNTQFRIRNIALYLKRITDAITAGSSAKIT